MFYNVQFCHEILSINVTVPTKSMFLYMWKINLRQCNVKCVESFSITIENHGTLAKKAPDFLWLPVEDTNISEISYTFHNLN